MSLECCCRSAWAGLGVITEVEMVIMPQDMVEREVTTTDFSAFVEAMQILQEEYNAALNGTGSKTVVEVLAEYEGTQVRRPLASHPVLCLSGCIFALEQSRKHNKARKSK